MAQPRSRTLPDLLDEITVRDPGHELIVGAGERVSYAETRELVAEAEEHVHDIVAEVDAEADAKSAASDNGTGKRATVAPAA